MQSESDILPNYSVTAVSNNSFKQTKNLFVSSSLIPSITTHGRIKKKERKCFSLSEKTTLLNNWKTSRKKGIDYIVRVEETASAELHHYARRRTQK